MAETAQIPLPDPRELSRQQMEERAQVFAEEMSWRRTVRDFSDQPVPYAVIEHCLQAAGRAPSGANQQPWHFVVVENSSIKREIRQAAEAEEKKFYRERATDEWLEALRPLGTDWRKPFLEKAPYLIAIFLQAYGIDQSGARVKHYYPLESVGIATGILITALHHAGLATLTHTPSPMGFLNEILGRPKNERPFLLLVTGLPSPEATVPAIEKKPLEEIMSRL